MQVIPLADLSLVVTKIKQGATLIFPTETSYGLGCDAANVDAVNKIFAIKGRDPSKPLLVVVPTVAMAQRYLEWNKTLERLAQKYWPGPLTIVGRYHHTPNTPSLASGVVATNGTVAVRVTKYPYLRDLTRVLDKPLVATSANEAGQPPLYDSALAEALCAQLSVEPDIIVDAGSLPRTSATTLVSVVDDAVQILRQGELVIDELY